MTVGGSGAERGEIGRSKSTPIKSTRQNCLSPNVGAIVAMEVKIDLEF